MALTLVPDVNLLVATMSANGTTWHNSIHVHNTPGGDLTDSSAALANFGTFLRGMVPNAGFLESISGYQVYQHHVGDAEVDHPPVFTVNYHLAGQHDTFFNGSPIGSPLPKDVAVYVKMATTGGRSGKLFVRNLLEESDVDSAVSGTWEFTAGSTRFTVARFDALVAGSMVGTLPGGSDFANEQFVVAHLLNVKAADARAAYVTNIASLTALRPVWNRAHR